MNMNSKDCAIFSIGLLAGAALALASMESVRNSARKSLQAGADKLEAALDSAKQTAVSAGEKVSSYQEVAKSAIDAGKRTFQELQSAKQSA